MFCFGTLFDVTDTIGSEIMKIKKDNFRQILKRSRDKIINFMDKRCEIFNSENPCKCRNKVNYLIE